MDQERYLFQLLRDGLPLHPRELSERNALLIRHLDRNDFRTNSVFIESRESFIIFLCLCVDEVDIILQEGV
jgi:hypothetical protein